MRGILHLKRLGWACLASALASASFFAGVAFGYAHSKDCVPIAAYRVCYDDTGQTYNSWAEVDVGFWNWQNNYTLYATCAYAYTAANNLRTGSGCDPSAFRYSQLSATTPQSQAQGWWEGTGLSQKVHVHASTTL